MKQTLREVFRLIAGTRKIFISLVLILGLGSLLLFGLTSDIISFDATVQEYKKECAVPDATAYASFFYPESTDELTSYGRVEYSFVCDCDITSVNGRRLTGRTFVDSTKHLASHFWVVDEVPPTEERDVLNVSADVFFTEYSDISLGDTVIAETPFGTVRCYIYRVLAGHEDFSISRDRINTFDISDFGYLMVDKDVLFKHLGIEDDSDPMTLMGLCTNDSIVPTTRISVYTNEDSEEAALDALEQLKRNHLVIDSFTDEKSPHAIVYNTSVDPIRAAGSFIPYLIFGVSVLVSVLFSLQLLERQRREIGILRALGYSGIQISVKYLLYHLLISLTSLVVGIGGGVLLARYLLHLQMISFGINKTVFVPSINAVWLSAVVILLIGQIGTLVFVFRIAKIDPVEAMTATSQKSVTHRFSYKPRFLSEIAVSHIRFAQRNKLRTLFSCFGIAITALFILGAVSCSGAMYRVSSEVFDYRLNYDACLVLRKNVTATEPGPFADNPAISVCEPIGQAVFTVSSQNGEEECYFNAIIASSELHHIRDAQGERVEMPDDGGIVLEYHTAQRLGVFPGDIVFVNDLPLKVTGICYHTVMHTQYVSFSTLQKLMNTENVVTGYLVRYNTEVTGTDTRTSGAEEKFYDALKADEDAFAQLFYVSYTRVLRNSMEITLIRFVPGIIINVMCGFIIGFLIIVNIGNLNYLERKRDYSILMVQGYSRFSAVCGTLYEHMIEYIIALIICAVGGLPLIRSMILSMETDRISFHVTGEGMSLLLTAAFLVLFLAVANIPLFMRARHADVAEALKAKE